MRALLLSGFGAALGGCTATEPAAPYPSYGGYYGYPPGYYYPYYYPSPAYGSFDFVYGSPWWGSPWWWDRPFFDRPFFDGPVPHRRFTQQPQAAPAPQAPSHGTVAGPGFLGNMPRQQPQASTPVSGGAQSGSSGGRRGFLGNALRQR